MGACGECGGATASDLASLCPSCFAAGPRTPVPTDDENVVFERIRTEHGPGRVAQAIVRTHRVVLGGGRSAEPPAGTGFPAAGDGFGTRVPAAVPRPAADVRARRPYRVRHGFSLLAVQEMLARLALGVAAGLLLLWWFLP